MSSLVRRPPGHPTGAQGDLARPAGEQVGSGRYSRRDVGDLSAALVAEHYHRHCAWAATLDAVTSLALSTITGAEHGSASEGSPVGATTSEQLLDTAAWVERNTVLVAEHLTVTFSVGREDGSGSLGATNWPQLIAEHLQERAWLCALFDEAGSVYAHRLDAAALQHPGAWVTGGITPTTVRLFPRHDEHVEVISMPLDWALAFFAAQT